MAPSARARTWAEIHPPWKAGAWTRQRANSIAQRPTLPVATSVAAFTVLIVGETGEGAAAAISRSSAGRQGQGGKVEATSSPASLQQHSQSCGRCRLARTAGARLSGPLYDCAATPRLLRPRAPQTPVRFETGPGMQRKWILVLYDIDFTREGRRRVYLFSYLLSYSPRRQYLRVSSSRWISSTTPARASCTPFQHLGGAARICLYDNSQGRGLAP